MMGFKRLFVSAEDFARYAEQTGQTHVRIYSVDYTDRQAFRRAWKDGNFMVITFPACPCLRNKKSSPPERHRPHRPHLPSGSGTTVPRRYRLPKRKSIPPIWTVCCGIWRILDLHLNTEDPRCVHRVQSGTPAHPVAFSHIHHGLISSCDHKFFRAVFHQKMYCITYSYPQFSGGNFRKNHLVGQFLGRSTGLFTLSWESFL